MLIRIVRNRTAWVELRAMTMKPYSTFPKASGLQSDSQVQFRVISGHSFGESYPSEEMQSAYSTTPADWAGDS